MVFKKGNFKINYDLLSHGEKQVIILLLNFIVRKEQYKDAIIYIDEMDCHLNTSLLSRLLSEIVNTWIPEDAQLWTASHALGFIDFAGSSENASIIDLALLKITPEPKESRAYPLTMQPPNPFRHHPPKPLLPGFIWV